MLMGAIAGGQKDVVEENTRRILDPASAQETAAGQSAYDSLAQLKDLIGRGPGVQSQTDSVEAQRSLAAMMQQFQQNGGMANADQTAQANQYAQQAYANQRQQVDNTFVQQGEQAKKSASHIGRNVDAVTTNKLKQEKERQLGQINANQGSYAAQYAQALPQQQIDYAGQYAQMQSELASQAMSNRQTLMGLGYNLQNSDRDFRNSTASVQSVTQSGGGFKGAVTGGMAETGSYFSALGGG